MPNLFVLFACYFQRLGKQIPNTSHSLPLKEYKGLYTDKMYGDAEILIKNGKLILSLLFAMLEFGLLTFNLDSDGQVQEFIIDLPSVLSRK